MREGKHLLLYSYVWKTEGKDSLEGPEADWRVILKNMGCEHVNMIQPDQDIPY
jgi:hypothetical protein